VRVAVLLDGIGDLYTRPRAAVTLAKRELEVARFLPPRLLPPSLHLNLRNHRKILAVDGRTAFVGGMNISDANTARVGPREITDIHFRLAGPVAADIERMGYEDWHFATGRRLDDADVSEEPHADIGSDIACRLISDGPDEALDRLALLIQAAVSSAKSEVDIMTPYFVPSREMIVTLQTAALRGVRVRVVLPARNNLPYVHWANRNMLAELLLWNVEAMVSRLWDIQAL
jgi:cardiolipin synthase